MPRILLLGLPVGLSLGCADPEGNTRADPAATCALRGDLEMTDAQNYRFSGTLDLGQIPVRALADTSVAWRGLTHDLRGRPLDPAGLSLVSLLEVSLTPEALADRVVRNALTQRDVVGVVELEPNGRTEARLSDFEFLGTSFNPEVDFPEKPEHSYVLSLWGVALGGREEILYSVILRPERDAELAPVVLQPGDSQLTVDAELEALTPQQTCAGLDYTLSWTALSQDAMGNTFDERLADRLILGRLPTNSLAEVEQGFLTLLEDAEKLYFLDVYGLRYAELNGEVSRVGEDGQPLVPRSVQGEAFPGFDDEGTWLAGLECMSCTSPTPLFLTVVEVVE